MDSEGQKHQPECADKTGRASHCFVQALAPSPQRSPSATISTWLSAKALLCPLTSCLSPEVGAAHTYSSPSLTNTCH